MQVITLRCSDWAGTFLSACEQWRRSEALKAFVGAWKQLPLGFGAEFTYILVSLGAWLEKGSFFVFFPGLIHPLSLLVERSKVWKQSSREGSFEAPRKPAPA